MIHFPILKVFSNYCKIIKLPMVKIQKYFQIISLHTKFFLNKHPNLLIRTNPIHPLTYLIIRYQLKFI
jgi:hypothetical protein